MAFNGHCDPSAIFLAQKRYLPRWAFVFVVSTSLVPFAHLLTTLSTIIFLFVPDGWLIKKVIYLTYNFISSGVVVSVFKRGNYAVCVLGYAFND